MCSKLLKSLEGDLVDHPLIFIIQILTPRFVWNFFRLENEHLNNCGQFRVVRDISIAPVDMKVIRRTTMIVLMLMAIAVSEIGETN